MLPPPAPTAETGSAVILCVDRDPNIRELEIERSDRLRRCISVYKTRGSGHDEQVRGMVITEAGVRVE